MSFGATMLAMSAVSAVSSISQGYAQKAEANYNATVLDEQANLIQAKKEIEAGQYQRLKGRTLSTSMANTAKMGIMPQGSALAAMINTQTQIEIDQAIGQFNLEQEKLYTQQQASQVRRSGSQAVRTGYSNAFSTMLSGASNYLLYSRGFDNSLRKK